MLFRNGFLAAVAVFAGLVCHSAIAEDFFFTDKGSDYGLAAIYRGDMDGVGPLVPLFDTSDGLIEPRGLGVDVAGEKIYWADAGTGKIQRANFDGSGRKELVIGRPFMADLELDLAAGKMYWAETSAGSMWSADLNGDNVTMVRDGLSSPYYFELDTVGGSIYWAELANSVVHRMNLDGTGPIDTIVSGQLRVRDLGLDLANNMIYFNDRDVHLIQRAPLDGSSGPEELFNFVPNAGKPHGMALDLDDQMIYWTDTKGGARWIMRGTMDGNSPQVLYSGLDSPWDIELAKPVPEPSTLVMAILGLAAGCVLCRKRQKDSRIP